MAASGIGRARTIQAVGYNLLRLITVITVIPIIGLVIFIVVKGAPAISWEFLTAAPSNGMREGGILPAIVGTLYLTLGTAIFSVPLGVLAGIYLAEYAKENALTRIIRIAIINLAGIPSVVYGLFGLGLFVLFLKLGTSILAASLTLSIMTLPTIISTTEEALRSVPSSFRVVSTSLGASRWQTVRKITLPQALPGIITGVILGLERAAGETAPILFTGATFFLPQLPALTAGRHDGAALSHFRNLHPDSGHACSDSVWYGGGAACFCAKHELGGYPHPLTRQEEKAVVKR